MRMLDLADEAARTPQAGGKAAPLARLLRAGFAVPDGFVVPAGVYRQAAVALGLDRLPAVHPTEARRRLFAFDLPAPVIEGVGRALEALLHGADSEYVAVRSSAVHEDGAVASGAGQHESVLAVRGTDQVCRAILQCWASLWSERAVEYRALRERGGGDGAADAPARAEPLASGGAAGGMGVLVQRFVDAEVSGVMFTGDASSTVDQSATATATKAATVIEASWGVGELLVAGRVAPDSWRVDESGILERRAGQKAQRSDRRNGRLVTGPVTAAEQGEWCLTDSQVQSLHALGHDVSSVLGGPRDIEWALADGRFWILQARPVTAPLPELQSRASAAGNTPVPERGSHPSAAGAPVPEQESRAHGTGTTAATEPRPVTVPAGVGPVLVGVPASPGVATGRAQVVRGPGDFAAVRPGDVLVCRETDPAWTPLFTIAAAVVTETGGVLSHAAIVAREVGIPAVLAVPRAAEVLAGGARVRVEGTVGRVTITGPPVGA
ncbi:pyruvate, phosphate dikinase [Cellulosimicrobium funkei]|nr:pyruvate, phosphate dikinase [Cellulosimicrobium funkei]